MDLSPTKLFNLSGKNAVVIGGTGVLCGMMAEGLAAAGAHAILVGRSEEKATGRIKSIVQAGGVASFMACNVNSPESIESLAQQVFEKHGSADILINGAGVNSATPFLDIPLEEFQQIINTNLQSVFLACQSFGKLWLAKKMSASVINVGSMSGVLPISRVFIYSATKAAVHNLSKNLAREWATSGIRVNTIVPGFFPAEQNRKILTPDRVESIMRHTPMKR